MLDRKVTTGHRILLDGVFLEIVVEFGNMLEEVSEHEETSIGGPVWRTCVVPCEDEFGVNGCRSWDDRIEANDKRVRDAVLESETMIRM